MLLSFSKYQYHPQKSHNEKLLDQAEGMAQWEAASSCETLAKRGMSGKIMEHGTKIHEKH